MNPQSPQSRGGGGGSQCQCMTPRRLIRVANLRFAQKKINLLHTLHILAKRKKKKENRCCFEEHSKTVTFHNHELMGRV